MKHPMKVKAKLILNGKGESRHVRCERVSRDEYRVTYVRYSSKRKMIVETDHYYTLASLHALTVLGQRLGLGEVAK